MDIKIMILLMYVVKAEVSGLINKNNVQVGKRPCPVDGYTRREYVKQLLRQLNRENPGVKERMFTAIIRGEMKGWPKFHGNTELS